MRAKLLSLLLVISSLAWLCAVVKYANWDPATPDLSQIDTFVERRSYAKPYNSYLVAVDLGDFSVPDYPHVETSPSQLKYQFVLVKEKYEAAKDELFMANKRVAELIKYSDHLELNHWKDQLDHYGTYIEKQKKIIDETQSEYVKTTLYGQLFRYVTKHHEDLLDAANGKVSLNGEAVQAAALISKKFDEILALIPIEYQTKTSNFYFPLDIVAQKEYGSYVLEVSTGTQSAESTVLQLKKDGRELPLNTKVIQGNEVFYTEEVEITSANDKVELVYSPASTISARLKPSVLARESTASAERSPTYTLHKQGPGSFVLSVENLNAGNQENLLSSLRDNWYVAHRENRDTSTDYTLQYWPKQLAQVLLFIVFPVLIILGAVTVIISSTNVGILPSVTDPIHILLWLKERAALVVRWLRRHGSQVRLPLLILFFVGLMVDVIPLSTTHLAPLTIVLIVIWVFVAVFYNIREKVHFVIGLLFFFLLPFFLLIHRESIAEKLASWSYLFFLGATIELLIRQIYRDHYKDSLRHTIKLIVKDIFHPTKKMMKWTILPIITFGIVNIKIIRKTVPVALLVILTLLITTNLTYQINFYQNNYRVDPLRQYLTMTGSYQIVLITLFLVLSFLLRKRLGILSRNAFVLFCVAVIQMWTFNLTTHNFRTQATITSLSKHSGAMWSEISIYGSNFGNAPYNGAAVYVDGVPQRILKWGNDEIIFVVDPINTRSGKLWVVNVDQKKTEEVDFEYIPL